MWLRPARAQVIYNGYRQARAASHRAYILDNRAPLPWRVVDRIVFTDGDGETVRADVSRWAAPQDDTLIVWHDRDRPHRFTVTGPVTWIALSLASIGIALWMWL